MTQTRTTRRVIAAICATCGRDIPPGTDADAEDCLLLHCPDCTQETR